VKRTIDVPEAGQGKRLDKIWAEALEPDVSRSSIAQWIKAGRAQVNAWVCRRPAYRVEAGDRLSLDTDDPPKQAMPMLGTLDVLYEDHALLVLNKQPGISVHPAPSEAGPTLVHYLLERYPELARLDPVRPGIVHRLDKETSGLLAVARTADSERFLADQLSERRVFKEYLALVHGRPERDESEIRLPLGRDPKARHKMAVVYEQGRQAISRYRIVETFQDGAFSLLAVRILTGRTHQIRVHLSAIGHPVVGDGTYGPAQWAELRKARPDVAKLVKRQMLHAWRLELEHPESKETLSFRQPAPKDIVRVLLRLGRRMQRVGITGMPGSGKSALTACLGRGIVPSWSADTVVAELYEPGSDGWEMIRRTFGQELLVDQDGPVDKQRLFRRMLESDSFRQEFLGLIHPLVRYRLKEFWRRHEGSRMTLAEVPLLIEAEWDKRGEFDVVVGVWCPREIRLKRLRDTRGWEESTLERLEAWQLSEEEKYSRVDMVVENRGSLERLQAEADSLGQALRELRLRSLRDLQDRLRRAGVI
jgi:23S rRNA pseudouridine1911/1915/1917 synthase